MASVWVTDSALNRPVLLLRTRMEDPALGLVLADREGGGAGGSQFDEAARVGMAKRPANASQQYQDDELWLMSDRRYGELPARVPMPFWRRVCSCRISAKLSCTTARSRGRSPRAGGPEGRLAPLRGPLRDSSWALCAVFSRIRNASFDLPLHCPGHQR